MAQQLLREFRSPRCHRQCLLHDFWYLPEPRSPVTTSRSFTARASRCRTPSRRFGTSSPFSLKYGDIMRDKKRRKRRRKTEKNHARQKRKISCEPDHDKFVYEHRNFAHLGTPLLRGEVHELPGGRREASHLALLLKYPGTKTLGFGRIQA